MRSSLLAALCITLLVSSPRAQIAWTKQTDVTARQGHAMVYDAARGRVVVFGGEFALRSSDDTWEWDGSTWIERPTAGRPAARNGHAMVYDSLRRRIVLFGGVDGTTRFGDTWEYDGGDWRLVATSGPAPRYWSKLAYETASGRTLLFGGSSGGGSALGDTWEWDGLRWTELAPVQSPSARFGLGLAYDAGRDRTVLFGGMDATLARLSDTWEWNRSARTWSPSSAPRSGSVGELAADLRPGPRGRAGDRAHRRWAEQRRPVELGRQLVAAARDTDHAARARRLRFRLRQRAAPRRAVRRTARAAP
jgi:hypothetical protein